MNSLNTDITDKLLLVREGAHSAQYRDEKYRVFRAEAGFGCKPYTIGGAVFGTNALDGERSRYDGSNFERILTEDEARAIVGGTFAWEKE